MRLNIKHEIILLIAHCNLIQSSKLYALYIA